MSITDIFQKNALRIMRISLVQVLISIAFASISTAGRVDAQRVLEKRITIWIPDGSIITALDMIEKEAGVTFMYNPVIFNKERKQVIKFKDERLSGILEKILSPYQVKFEVFEQRIILQRNARPSSQLLPHDLSNSVVDRTVSGTVRDGDGLTLPGVNVVIKGTQRGTTTDGNGKFDLQIVDDNVVLVFSFVGFLSQEIPVGSRNQFDIKLVEDSQSLEELVVVGYGTQKRANVTSAISSVPMSEIKDMPVSNLATALQGKIAGVVIQQNNGTPGNSPAIKVRGFGSITVGNGPLIVLDGNIVGPGIFGLLNSNDIESIDVLKDASSTAIYGSKGANGVLMVTTKKGKSGKTQVSLDVFTGFQEVSKKLDLLTSQQYAELSKDASNNAYLDNIPGAKITDPNSARPTDFLRYRYPRGEIFEWFNFDDPAKINALPYYDYQDMIFRQAKMNNYQISVSGGTEKSRYLVSAGYLKQDGIIKRSALDRYSIRANVEADVTSRIKIGMNLNPTFKNQREVRDAGHWADNAVINAALSAIPMAPVYAADGVTYSSQSALAPPYNLPGITNPIANITEYNSTLGSLNLLGNAYAEYSFFKDFRYRVSGNFNLLSERRNAYRTSGMPLNQILPPSVSTGTAMSGQELRWLFNQTLGYHTTLKEAHDFDVLVGMESTRFQYQVNSGAASSYPNDVVETLNGSASGSTTTATSSIVENTSASYFARVNYNYKGRYLANFSVRRDGSSVFGPDNRWGTFPAGSIGWRINEEPFMKAVSQLSEAKLRVSYGLSGNNAFTEYYPYLATLKSDNYSLNNILVNGLAPSSLNNSKLGWEKSQQFDAGIDIGLFDNRIYLIIDYYQRITKDLLLSVNVPTLTGFGSAIKNIGKMENKGWEFSLNTRNLTKAFVWSTSLNFSLNRNKVLALGPAGDPIRSNSGIGETNITMIGQPIGSFYGYRALGVFKDKNDLDTHPHDATSRPGDMRYEDINGDRKITADDRTIIGNNQPDFIYGITNVFSFKGFDLNVALQGTQGGEILNLSRRFFENLEGNANQMTTVLTRWRSESDPGDGMTPRANARTTGNNNAVSTRWIEDGSYLRIQNVSIGYQLPSSVLKKIKLQQVRVYASGQNLHTWTKYTNFNPEVSNYEGPFTGGVDYGVYPLARTFTLGLNASF